MKSVSAGAAADFLFKPHPDSMTYGKDCRVFGKGEYALIFGYEPFMAEIFGTKGDSVTDAGVYACSDCGHREHFDATSTFPDDHHEGHPWTMMVRDEPDESPSPA